MLHSSLQKQTFVYLSLVLVGISSLSLASENRPDDSSILIVTPVWENFTETDGKGFYFDLIRMIYEPLGISITHQITPWARSELMVRHRQADALLGSYKIDEKHHHYPSQALWLDISAAAFQADTKQWQGVKSLAKQNVGWIRGYRYDNYLDAEMSIFKLIDNKQAWELLRLGRIDYYVNSLTDLNLYVKNNPSKKQSYRFEPVLTKKMYIRFAKTEKGKKLAALYDTEIVKLINEGALKALYEKWGYGAYYTKFINAQ